MDLSQINENRKIISFNKLMRRSKKYIFAFLKFKNRDLVEQRLQNHFLWRFYGKNRAKYRQQYIHLAFFVTVMGPASSYASEESALPQELVNWGVNPQFFTLQCLEGTCSSEKRKIIVNKIISALQSMPEFLKNTKIEMLFWKELNSGEESQGNADQQWNSISFSTSIDSPIERVLVHEIAHLWDETDHTTASRYLKIRYYTKEYQKLLEQLWAHMHKINEPQKFKIKDDTISEILTKNNMLRRNNTDVHASDVYEYWAISIELYYRYKNQNMLNKIEDVLSLDEINYLSKLKWD